MAGRGLGNRMLILMDVQRTSFSILGQSKAWPVGNLALNTKAGGPVMGSHPGLGA